METLCVYILRSSSFFNVYFFSSAKQDITFSFAFVFLVHSLVITLSVCLSSLLWHSSDSHSLSSSLFWNKQYNIVCSEVVITCVCVCVCLYTYLCVFVWLESGFVFPQRKLSRHGLQKLPKLLKHGNHIQTTEPCVCMYLAVVWGQICP